MRIAVFVKLFTLVLAISMVSCTSDKSSEQSKGDKSIETPKSPDTKGKSDVNQKTTSKGDKTTVSKVKGIEMRDKTVAEVITTHQDMTTMARFASEPFNYKILNKKENLLVFVVSDIYVNKMLDGDQYLLIEKGNSNDNFLQNFFQDFIFFTKQDVLSRLNEDPQFYIKNMKGNSYSIQKAGSRMSVNYSNIIGEPIFCKNGTVCVVDAVIDETAMPSYRE